MLKSHRSGEVILVRAHSPPFSLRFAIRIPIIPQGWHFDVVNMALKSLMRRWHPVPSLDGLRAISIALVIVDHLGFGAPYFGALGVQYFSSPLAT